MVQHLSQRGASANEWANSVSTAVGGKAGGKGPTSIGSGVHVDKIPEGVDVATEYLEKLKLL